MWPCLCNASVLHVVNMKSRRSEGFLMVFVENEVKSEVVYERSLDDFCMISYYILGIKSFCDFICRVAA